MKKTKVKLDLLTVINVTLNIINGRKRYKRKNISLIESSYIQCWDVNNFSSWTISQKLPVNNFEWIKEISQFNEDFIKNYNEESDK